MEQWSPQADEYVANGSKLRKVAVIAHDWDEAVEKAVAEHMTPEEQDEYRRQRAGVL